MYNEYEFFENTIKAIDNALSVYKYCYKVNHYYNNDGDVNMQEYVMHDNDIFKTAIETINKRIIDNYGIYNGVMLQYDTGRTNGKIWIGCMLSINMFKDFSIELFFEEL